ncbi:hypothetical protein EVAR_10644_1 [Eumeta japonica]|uniref:Uncharacterized protein n=1 Tax=Eumeta variegata TaxID=151549 RepID=A0A4C1U6Y3_EUMVA|nr:hypothetical protein EVAR_10644_1 [Eumeta japonica]
MECSDKRKQVRDSNTDSEADEVIQNRKTEIELSRDQRRSVDVDQSKGGLTAYGRYRRGPRPRGDFTGSVEIYGGGRIVDSSLLEIYHILTQEDSDVLVTPVGLIVHGDHLLSDATPARWPFEYLAKKYNDMQEVIHRRPSNLLFHYRD